jgi:ArsR family transcriptional regulator
MPRYVSPSSPMPQDIAVMTEILGIPALRVAILRYLTQHPQGATSGEMATAIGTRYQTVQRHLDQLEELGAVEASIQPPRQGHHVLFALKPGILKDAVEKNSAYIQGHDTP